MCERVRQRRDRTLISTGSRAECIGHWKVGGGTGSLLLFSTLWSTNPSHETKRTNPDPDTIKRQYLANETSAFGSPNRCYLASSAGVSGQYCDRVVLGSRGRAAITYLIATLSSVTTGSVAYNALFLYDSSTSARTCWTCNVNARHWGQRFIRRPYRMCISGWFPQRRLFAALLHHDAAVG